MTLALRGSSGVQLRPEPTGVMALDDVWDTAAKVAKSGFFGSTQEQVFALMLLCQADGKHPIEAMRRYHLLQIGSRVMPTMRADAMQAEFQAAGGSVVVVERSAVRAAAMFSHPDLQPEPALFDYTMEDAVKAGDASKNPNYKTRPKAMLWARLITAALTTIAPGIKTGIMATEEAEDLAAELSPAGQLQDQRRETQNRIAASQLPVPGWDGSAPDNRPYHEVVSGAVVAIGLAPEKRAALHRDLTLKAIGTGKLTCPPPTSSKGAIAAMTPLYKAEPNWVRSEVAAWCGDNTPQTEPVPAEAVVQAEVVAAEDASQEEDPDIDLPYEPGSEG